MPPLSDSAEGCPHAGLTGLVESYSGTALSGFTPGIHIGTPGLTLPLILTLRDNPVVQLRSLGDRDPMIYTALVAGFRMAPVLIDHASSAETLVVQLTPLGVQVLFGAPASELFGISVHATDLLGPSVDKSESASACPSTVSGPSVAASARLRQRVEHLSDWPSRFAAVDADLLARRADRPPSPTLADVAWRAICADRGRQNISVLAERLGSAPRTVHASLIKYLGIGPKALSRIARFGAAREIVHSRLLNRSPDPKLAMIAAECGYADEAHLIRDWRAFAGGAPTRWRDDDEFAFHPSD